MAQRRRNINSKMNKRNRCVPANRLSILYYVFNCLKHDFLLYAFDDLFQPHLLGHQGSKVEDSDVRLMTSSGRSNQFFFQFYRVDAHSILFKFDLHGMYNPTLAVSDRLVEYIGPFGYYVFKQYPYRDQQFFVCDIVGLENNSMPVNS